MTTPSARPPQAAPATERTWPPGGGCDCGRRRFAASTFTALLSGPLAWRAASAQPSAASNLPECRRSGFTQLVAAEEMEQASAQQYAQMLQQARAKGALAPPDEPALQRLRNIARRLIPYATACNGAAARWRWEVNLIGSDQVNAFCMPGGKIAFYSGILDRLRLSDDEVAMVMGHEMAHALLEHASERVGKTATTQGLLEVGAALFGLGDLGRLAGGLGTQLLSLRFSRSDESEADALGLVLGAEAGFDPRASVSLWQKMGAASGGAPPQWLSTHPSNGTRIRELQARLPRAQQLYAQARRSRSEGARFSD